MSLTMTRYAEQDTLPYRYTNDEPFENISQPAPRQLYSVSSASPLPSSWHTFPEAESFPNTSTTGSQNYAQPAYTNLAHDVSRHGDCPYGREFFPPSRGYDARALEHPLDPPSASSQYTIPRGMVGQLPPRVAAHPVMYTDDAGLKLCDRIRRQCSNCKATTTTTWRRSMLSQGKLVCNKCGLFERTHSVPRPKTFPRKRRSLRSSVQPSEPPTFNHLEHRHRDDHMTSAGHFPSAFGSMGGETNSLDTTWMTDNVPSTSPCLTPPHTVSQPTTYRANFHLPGIIPADAASLPFHLDHSRLPVL